MVYKVYGDRISTGDFEELKAFQFLKLNKNMSLLSVRVGLVVFNSPVYSALRGHIYTVQNSAPSVLIATADNFFRPAEVCTEGNGVKEIYFEFKYPYGLKLYGQDQFAFVLTADDYVGDADSHLAMLKSWPDPVYKTGYTPTMENLAVAPRNLEIFGAKL